ncbi:MAG: hypothetical protein LBR23_00535 [Spirochaetaceae bacterium]|jgi:hypothetical protein|nr:hypothetical protein [Spirochaetaceae bacterium]
MKRKIMTMILILAVVLGAQAQVGMNLSGAAGLFTIPAARNGWGGDSNLALDVGYHTVITQDKVAEGYVPMNHLAAVNLSILKWVEIGAALDIQPERYAGQRPTDFLLNYKINFPIKMTSIGLGGNFQFLNFASQDGQDFTAGQVYAVVTYTGTFFDMPAETSAVIGKTFYMSKKKNNSDIDFGMGFDLVLAPEVFKEYVHLVIDFANFSYSDKPWGADGGYRGILNTGIRVNLGMIPALSKMKLMLDILGTDLFDSGRAFSVAVVFGKQIL